MSDGWIKLHRQIQHNDIWTSDPFSRGQAWVDLLLLANHKEGIIYVRGNKIKVQRGQVAWSQKRLSERWQWSRGKVARFLQDLENESQIEQQKNFITSLVTITKYEDYQKTDSKQTANGQQTEQQTDTNKNVKNVKNDKEDAPIGANGSDPFKDSKEVATYLLKAIQDYDPTHRFCRKAPNVDGWVGDIDRAMRLDGRTKDGLKHMIHILFYENVSGVSDFWAGNIESGKKLRVQFDKIKNQLKEKGYGKRQKTADIIDSMYR